MMVEVLHGFNREKNLVVTVGIRTVISARLVDIAYDTVDIRARWSTD